MIKNYFNYKQKLALFIFQIVVANCFSQSLANYTSARSIAVPYTSINSTGLPFNSWRNTTTFTQDDNRSDFTDIGFDFWYNGVRYTQFSVSTNGFIDFSSSNDNGDATADDFGYNNAAFTGNGVNNTTSPAIAPFYDDLMAQGGTAALGNSIKYRLTGAAPSRTLTVEWINMAVYGNTSPSLNFQVQLVENTGRIFVNYGTMNSGTFTFSYSMGLNGQTLSFTPTAAELKTLQTVNSNTFNNVERNNLSVMPAANSRYVFIPVAPNAPSGTLAFSSVTQSSMILNWTNWASNEVGYVIYNSTDGTNYNFVTQTAANASSATITGLLPSTNYFWKVQAVTEGCLSAALTGTQATIGGGNKISINTGNWNTATTWSPTGVPNSGDDVTIASNHTVSINATVSCNNLTIGNTGAAAKLEFVGLPKTLSINSNLTVTTGATFNVSVNSNSIHNLMLNGNVSNSGTINFSSGNDLCNVTFLKNGNQTVSGNATTNAFYNIIVNKGTSSNNVLEITSSNFTAPVNFLTLTNGTFKLSTLNTVNVTPFNNAVVMPQSTGLWLNSPNLTVNTNNLVTLTGKLTVANGTLNIGNGTNEDLLSSGGTINLSGGALNIAGKYYSTGINNLTFLSITGGTLTVPFVSSSSTADSPFQISGVGSVFNMSDGLIIIPREGGTGAQDLGYNTIGATNGSVTGGTLQIGSTVTPASQTISINSGTSIGNLVVNSANAIAKIITNPLIITKDIAINTGTLNANNLNITLGGNWTNTSGTFVPGTANVTFNATTPQTLFKTTGEIFNNLTFSGSGTKTLLSAITGSNVLINSGSSLDVNTTNNQLTVRGNFTNSGTFISRAGLVFLNGTVAQTIGGTSITDFYNLTLNNNAGANITNAENLINTLTLNNGTFNTNSQAFTMISTATNTARIAQITGTGDIIGNVIVQRFAPGGYTGWALLGTPISSALTLQAWDDDIPISCATCPDGSAAGFLSIYTYDETKPGLFDDYAAYIPLSGITDPISQNKGYWVYLGTGSVTSTGITLDVTGTVRKFNNTIPLTRTSTGVPANDGWNLIHNPYPSPIKWSLLRGATANIDNAFYTYNADLNGGTGGHATYVNGISSPAIGAGGIGDDIPMCQGFYVHSTGATALNATEAIKVAGNPTFLKMNSTTQVASTNPLLRIYIDGQSSFHDETVLYMQSGANSTFDDEYDALKLRGQDPYAPIIALDNVINQFQVNGVGPITSNFTMPLTTTTGYAGTYTISLDNFNSFPSGACINLFDRYTNTTTDLKTNDYVFYLSDTTKLSRFDLNITLNPLTINSSLNQTSCSLPQSGKIIAAGTNSGPWNYYWKDASSTIIKTSLNKSSADTLENLSGGDYTLEVNTVGMCDNNESQYSINIIELPVASFTNQDTVDLSSGGLVLFDNTSTNSSSYTWNFGDGSGFSSDEFPNYNYTTTGTYTITLITTSNSGCIDTTYGSLVVTNIVSGVQELANTNNWQLLTLSNNEYVIQADLEQEELISIKLHDAIGKLVMDLGSSKTSKISIPLDLRNYNAGIYFLNINGETTKKTIKLLVN